MIAIRTTSPTLLAGGGKVGSEYWPSILRSASNSRHGGITLKRRRADNVEAFGGQLQRVWFNDDVDLNRVND
jgi:hypothetical protein